MSFACHRMDCRCWIFEPRPKPGTDARTEFACGEIPPTTSVAERGREMDRSTRGQDDAAAPSHPIELSYEATGGDAGDEARWLRRADSPFEVVAPDAAFVRAEESIRRHGSSSDCRRAYYRVPAILPVRITPLEREAVEAAIFDLSLPDPLAQPIAGADDEEDAPLMARLRRIEEKLDLLLGASPVEVPESLTGKDRRPVVFSGSGLALDVPFSFKRGDPFKVEILLPAPYCRIVRSVAEAVRDPSPASERKGQRFLALALRHMEDDERDTLVAYSYDVQRAELRARNRGGVDRG